MWNPFKKKESTEPSVQPANEPTAPAAVEPSVDPSSTTGPGSSSEGIKAPVAGRLVSLDEVPDPVFAQRMMGEGFAVDPTGNVVCAPVDGEIMMIAPTSHAFAIRTPMGVEILVHIGLDTVNLKGTGFTVVAKEGQYVQAGDPVVEVDWEQIKGSVPAIVTPVVVTNGSDFSLSAANLEAGEGQDVLRVSVAQ